MMQQKVYTTVEGIILHIMCCLEELFKYVPLETLSNVFQEFPSNSQITKYISSITKSFKTLYIKQNL